MKNRKDGFKEELSKEKDIICPAKYYVVIKPDSEPDSKTIIVPDSVQHRTKLNRDKGTIISIGPTAFPLGVWGDSPPTIGNRVLFSSYAGSVFYEREENGSKTLYRLLSDEDIHAVIKSKGE